MVKKTAIFLILFLSGCSYASDNQLVLEGEMDCNMVTRKCKGKDLKSTAMRKCYFTLGQTSPADVIIKNTEKEQ